MGRSNIEGALLSRNRFGIKNKYETTIQTLSGTFTISEAMAHILFLDPGGAGRTVLLPAETNGGWFVITNTADATEALTVKEDSNTTTIGTIPRAGCGYYVCDGTTWYEVTNNVLDIALALTGGAVNSALGLLTIGPVVTDTGVNVSANTNRVAGLSSNIWNSGATITGLRGIDSRVKDDGGTGSANIVGVQAVATKVSGVGSGELWGANFIVKLEGGFVENMYGVVGDLTITGTGAVGTAGRPDNYVGAGVFTRDVASTAVLANATVDAAIIAVLVGNNSNSATKAKADGIVVGIIGGDSATVTGGAGFKLLRHTSIAASILDYGVDLLSAEGGGYLANSFAVADVRLSGGPCIHSGSGSPNGSVTGAKGSIYLNFTAGSADLVLYVNTDGGTTWTALTST